MSMFNNSMFDSIKDALNKQTTGSRSGISDIIRCEKGNSYTLRLLPNIEDPSKTFFHYFVHGWESLATGQYISFVSPQTFDERDPIAEYRYKVYRTGDAADKEKSRAIIRSEKWLVNAYVVDDPSTPDNIGKVKVLRFGKQLHKIIMDAISGEDKDQFGSKIFDLSDAGCNLRVRCDDQGGFPTYVASKFLMPSAIPGIDADSVYSSTTALDQVFSIKSYDELQASLNEHYHCLPPGTVTESSSVESTPSVVSAPVESVSPATKPIATDVVKPSAPAEDATATPADDLDDDKIKMLLQGLDG